MQLLDQPDEVDGGVDADSPGPCRRPGRVDPSAGVVPAHGAGSGCGRGTSSAHRRIMILAMPVRNDDKTLSRKQRLQEKQRRQLAVVDTVDKAEAKVRKAEVELAGAVTEAVQVFGDEQSASEGLDMPVEAIRRFLAMAQDEAAGAGDAVGAS
ncbi:hypothetical protein GCM10010247_62840 [Streptomyces calvus]|nr:hypothetical protein GCM10010247_62840 [Streptomyces calvus]